MPFYSHGNDVSNSSRRIMKITGQTTQGGDRVSLLAYSINVSSDLLVAFDFFLV